ncbi:MAG: glycosyltransferase family 1 protein [Bacteroidota bacterium]
MRIAVNTRFLLPNKLEGIGWFTHEVLKRMVKEHPEDEFVFIFDRSYDKRFVFADNVKPVVLAPPARHPILWYLWFEWSIPLYLKYLKADVFFSPDAYCSLRAKTPTVMVTHDIAHHHFPEMVPGIYGKYYNYYVPKFIDRADHIITVSEFVKNDIVQTYQTDDHKITVACNGAREIFKPLNEHIRQGIRKSASNGKPYFFYVGAVHPRKNVDRLITAFDQFKSTDFQDYQLLIGGRFAWDTGPVKTAYENSNYKDSIHFLGYLLEDDLANLMASADALTYISNFEGFGMPILEAMYCDVPIITSNVSSMPEVVGPAGICVDPNNINEIVDAMHSMARNPGLRADLVKYGKDWRTRFTWERAAQVIYEALDRTAQLK